MVLLLLSLNNAFRNYCDFRCQKLLLQNGNVINIRASKWRWSVLCKCLGCSHWRGNINMNWASTTQFLISCMLIQLSFITPQTFSTSSTSFADNSTLDNNLMTVEKSLIVSPAPSNDSQFVVSDVNYLEKSVFKLENAKNESLSLSSLKERENSTDTDGPEKLQEKLKPPDQGQIEVKVNEGQIKVQTNSTVSNFTASPYLGSIPDDNSDRYRFNNEVLTKINGGDKYRIAHGGPIFTKNNTRGPFGVGTVSEPIYFNTISEPGTKYQNLTNVKNKESINLGSRGYSYSQRGVKPRGNVSAIQSYPDVKPEASINSFPYHYEGGEPKHGLKPFIEGQGGGYLGVGQGFNDQRGPNLGSNLNGHGSYSGVPEGSGVSNFPNQGLYLGGHQQSSEENFRDSFENGDYPRVPVSPPPWMVPPPVENHHHVRFPNVKNPADIEKPVRFEHNIDSVVFTTEVPRSGQLETPFHGSGSYPESHQTGYEVHSYGSTHKMSPMSQALKFLATLVPLGLFVAALTPAVVNVNATQGVTRSRPGLVGAGGREISDRLPSGAATLEAVEAEQCDMRQVCEAALSSADDSSQSGVSIEERVYSLLAKKSPKIPLTTYALDELFSMIRRKSCSSFACNTLTKDDIDKWTTTETATSFSSSSNQETTSAPKKIKRKKKKIPPIT